MSCPVFFQKIAELELHTRFNLILIPFHSFSELVNERRRRAALNRIRKHLTESGTFNCTLHNPPIRTASMAGELHPIGDFPTRSGDRLVVQFETLIGKPGFEIAAPYGDYDRKVFEEAASPLMIWKLRNSRV